MFDFGKIAHQYDSFYDTALGRDVDVVEKRMVREMVQSLPMKLSLEVGCGTGHWTEFFTSHGFPIVGIDVSDRMIEVARSKNIPGAMFLVKNVEDMDFRDESFDNVFAITALEFVDNLDKAISQIYRVLRPGGYLLVGGLNANSPYIKDKMKKASSSIAQSRPFTPEQLRSLLLVFGEPQISAGVIVEGDRVLDKEQTFDQDTLLRKGAFLVGLVQKTR